MIKKLLLTLTILSIPTLGFPASTYVPTTICEQDDVDCTGKATGKIPKYSESSGKFEMSDDAGAASGAPTDATYITQTANGSLSAEQALSGLSTGIMKVTNGTGVISTATAGTDYVAPDADLTTLATPTAWRLFYSNGSQAITELALGASGKYLKANGTTSAPTWANMYNIINVKDYGAVGDDSNDDTTAITDAIAAVSTGGVIYFPIGTYKVTSTVTLPNLPKGLVIMGDMAGGAGSGSESVGSIIHYTATDSTNCFSTADNDSTQRRVYIKDIGFKGNASAGVGLYLRNVHDSELRNVHITGFGSHGLVLYSGWHTKINQATSKLNGGWGIITARTSTLLLDYCISQNNALGNLFVNGYPVLSASSDFSAGIIINGGDYSMSTAGYDKPNIQAQYVGELTINGVYIENTTATTRSEHSIAIYGYDTSAPSRNIFIFNSTVASSDTVTGGAGELVYLQSVDGVKVENNRFVASANQTLTGPVALNGYVTNVKYGYNSVDTTHITNRYPYQVSATGCGNFFIEANNGDTVLMDSTSGSVIKSTSVGKSILELNSTTKGFLQPRMTTTQRTDISSPPTGLMVYDTTLNQPAVFNGTAWNILTRIDDTKGNGDATYTWSADKIYDELALKQGADADLTDLADGSLTASKVAGVADADYGDVTVSSGAWAVEDDSHAHTSGTLPVATSYLGSSISEAELSIADNTTGNASASAHGFLLKLENTGSKYLRDDGTWQTVAGGAHDAVTLAADAGAILGLSTQEINLDTQTANYVFAGPTSGAAADPTFRALVAGDIPDISATYQSKLTNSAGLAGALSDETGTAGSAVLSNSPTFDDDITIHTSGVKLTGDGDGALTILGLGDGSDEDITLNLDDTANTAVISSSTGVTAINLTSIGMGLGGNLTLNENGIILDSALSADGTYSGITEAGTAGATLAFGDLVYLNNDDSRWELADANLSDGYDKKLGICVLAAASDGDATTVLLWGKVRGDTAFPSLTIGAPVYMSETAGDIVTAQPTTTDAAIRVIGTANTADELFFCPSTDYITHT